MNKISPKTRVWLEKILSACMGLELILILLIGSVGLVVFNKGFYQQLYDGIRIEEQVNASREDIDKAINMLVDYVSGSRDDLDETVVWNGRKQPVYNEREITHMKDVRNLWQNALEFTVVMAILFVFSLALLYFLARKNAVFWFCEGYKAAAVGFLVFLILLAGWMLADFTSFWTTFHHIFFSNNLWLLDPATDFMIVICPEAMFSSMIQRILLVFGAAFVLLLIFSQYMLKRKAPIGFTSE